MERKGKKKLKNEPGGLLPNICPNCKYSHFNARVRGTLLNRIRKGTKKLLHKCDQGISELLPCRLTIYRLGGGRR